jgi:hypothetical protein
LSLDAVILTVSSSKAVSKFFTAARRIFFIAARLARHLSAFGAVLTPSQTSEQS